MIKRNLCIVGVFGFISNVSYLRVNLQASPARAARGVASGLDLDLDHANKDTHRNKIFLNLLNVQYNHQPPPLYHCKRAWQ